MGNEKEATKILIVDDSEVDLEVLQSHLEELGFQNIIKCSNGFDAIRLAEEHRPALILTDIMMPGMDGGALKERLNDNPETKGIPTVFVSSIITKKEQEEIEQLTSGDVIIAKPFSADEILKAIDLVLGNA